MADCCAVPKGKASHPRKHCCPRNGREYAEVSTRTIALHIQRPWAWSSQGRRYFFCEDPDCEVAYFADDDSVILKSQLRTRVGLKEQTDDALICYCYGVTRGEARTLPEAKAYVMAQTRQGLCACDTTNPSGRCCLKDFPDALA